MTDFLNNILSFPTLFFTGLLGLTILYWLIAVIGFADFDFDSGTDGIDLDVDVSDAGASGWLSKLKLDGIPITISVSFVVLMSWVICFLLVHYYDGQIKEDWLEIIIGLWVIIIVPVISAVITGLMLSPLKPVFKKMGREAEGRKADSLVGETVIIRTNKVTLDFGDADIDKEGASLILKVRAEEPNEMKRGDKVLITGYASDNNTYTVKLI